MNDIEKQEQDPSSQQQAESTAPATTPDVAPNLSKTPLVIALLALMLALGGLVVSYQRSGDLNVAMQQGKEELDKLKEEQDKAKQRLDGVDKAMASQQEAFTQQDKRLQQQVGEMQQSLDLVYERIGRSSTQWLVAEAEYLMRIANHRLQLEGDSATALVALERADKRLHDSGDPAWTAVREELASEMVELKALQELDLAGQVAKLSGLISQIGKLKLPHTAPVVSESAEEGAKQEKEFNLDTVLQDSWEGFKSLLVVRRNDRPLTAMLEPEQRFFLYQNLHLQLEAARLALLRRDQALFDASLQRAETWIKEFFDQEQALTKSMLQGVIGLRKLELETEMPDISGSLRMLLEQQGRVDAGPEKSVEQAEQPGMEQSTNSGEQEQDSQEPDQAGEEQQQINQEQPQLDIEQKQTEEGQKEAP